LNYTLSDLIQKLIDIEKDFFNIYVILEEKSNNKSSAIYAVIKAIKKREKDHIKYYEKLKDDLTNELNETIEFYLYDKISKLLSEFKLYIHLPEIKSVQDLIKYTVEFKRDNIGLLLDIQGRLLEKIDDVNSNVYRILSQIIKDEEKQEKMFEKLLIFK
jgi:SepF-like predicted cell division protein (DUF552 family)